MSESRRRLLPPITALASFVAAAKHNSFSRAGEDMGLTQSAVSRQIALLESWLGLTLFNRIGRRVQVSDEGKIYMNAIGPALDHIRHATGAAIYKHSENELNIVTLPSFGMRWLAPRLPRLTSKHPEIIINFTARSYPFNLSNENFDAAIHYGEPDWPGAIHELLFPEESIAVCSLDFLHNHQISCPNDLLRVPLLAQASRRDAWSHWFKAAGLTSPPPPASATFEHFLMLAQAAAAGAGMGLIPRFMIEPEINDGSLIAPLDIPLITEKAYYFVYPVTKIRSKSFLIFQEWLISEARGNTASPSPEAP